MDKPSKPKQKNNKKQIEWLQLMHPSSLSTFDQCLFPDINVNAGMSNINKWCCGTKDGRRCKGLWDWTWWNQTTAVPTGNKVTVRLHDYGHMVTNHSNGTERGSSPWRWAMGVETVTSELKCPVFVLLNKCRFQSFRCTDKMSGL